MDELYKTMYKKFFNPYFIKIYTSDGVVCAKHKTGLISVLLWAKSLEPYLMSVM